MLDINGDGAVLSECGKYRYRLDRHVGAGEKVFAFFGVNPSTADASIDDQTVRKWRGFSERMGAKRFIVGNAFAYRATDVSTLRHQPFPVGPEWRDHIDQIVSEADVLVPCWGARGKLPLELHNHILHFGGALMAAGKPIKCWGMTKSGDPKHPLMLGYDTPLVDFTS